MSREIDERIVAMYFDNKNFESGAQQTLKTLDELKKSCNMEGVGKGFEAFENVSKKLNLDDLRKKTDRVKSSFEGLGGVIKKTFNFATSPLRAFKGEIDQLNGYIGKVFGIDLASKIVGNLENAFRSLTVAPISAGWNQYENTMDSIKTIMSSTGEDIDTVKMKLGEMTTYANQTIYSLNDMTSNLGKFTNNGVKLDDATNAMIGLANATADAGQGAAQASMAMYNVSQAIGVGKMTTIDWKSLENANIATRRLKQTFIDAAVAHGTLEKKVEKDAKSGAEVVKYYTKAEKGSKAMEVSVENFRETLNKGWLDKTSMMNTFAIFSGQLTADEIAALGFSKEESARLYQIGQEAMAAATEVRTFSKMMDALRESVQSGWATSFEYIFGDMQEGTNLWTEINNRIDSILSKSTENRNNILMSWRGLMRDEDGQIRRIEDVYNARKQSLIDDYSNGHLSGAAFNEKMLQLEKTLGDRSLWIDYRQVAIDTFWDIFDVIQSVSSAVKGAFTSVFGEFNADTLKRLTQGFRDFVAKVKSWLGDVNDADSRLGKIRKGLTGIFNIAKLAINAFKTGLRIAFEMVKPIIDPLLNLFAKLGEWLNLDGAKNLGDMLKMLRDRFLSFWNTVKELGFSGVMAKIGQKLTSLWQSMKNGVRTFMYDNGLGGVYEWFVGLKEKLVSGYNAVKEWWNDPSNGIATFFKGIYETVTSWFTPGEDGSEAPIVEFFGSIRTKIETAYNELSTWWQGSGIPDFFERIWNEVTGWFKPITVIGKMGNTYEIDSPIVTFFNNIWSGIETAYNELSKWWEGSGIPDFFERMWNEVTSWFQPVTVIGKMGNTYEIDSPIVSFFKNLWSGIQDAVDEIRKWWDGSGIPDFFERMWNEVTSWFQPVTVIGKMGNTYEIDSPIVSFFKNLWSGIQDAVDEIRKWWDGSGIADFFERMWNEVTSWFQPITVIGKMGNTYEIDSPIVAFFKNIWSGIESVYNSLKQWWEDNKISEFFEGIWNAVSGVFKENPETGKAPIVEFFEGIASGLSSAWEAIDKFFTDNGVYKFFTDVWGWITEKLGLDGNAKGDGKNAGKLSGLLIAAGGISDSNSMGSYSSRMMKSVTSDEGLPKEAEQVPIVKFFMDIVGWLEQAWNNVVSWKGWESIGTFFTETFEWLIELFTKTDEGPDTFDADGNLEQKKNLLQSIGDFIKGIIESIASTIREIGSTAEAKALMSTLKDILEIIKNTIEIIVGFLKRVTETIKTGDTSNLQTGDWLIPVLGIVSHVISTILTIKKTNSLTKLSAASGIFTDIGGQVLKLAAGIALLTVALKYLGTIPTPQLIQGGIAIAALTAVLLFVIPKITSLVQAAHAKNPVTSTERILGKLISTLGLIGSLWVVMDKLPAIISALSEAKKYSGLAGSDIFDTLKGVLLTIGGLMAVLAVVNKIAPSGLSVGASMKTVLVGILAFAAVLTGVGGFGAIIVNALDALKAIDIKDSEGKLRDAETIRKELEPIVAIYSIMGEMIHDLIAGMLGIKTDKQKIAEAADLSETMAQIAETFNLERVSGVLRIAQMISSLTSASKNVDTGKLGNMAEAMGNLGDALNKFAWIVFGDPETYTGIAKLIAGGDDAYQKYTKAIDEVKLLMSVFEPLYMGPMSDLGDKMDTFTKTITGDGGTVRLADFIDALNAVIHSMGGLEDGSNVNFDGINIVKKLYEAIQTAFDNPTEELQQFNATPIVDAIVLAIGLGDTAIAQAVHDMVQKGIDLVGNGQGYKSYDTDGLMNILNGDGGMLNFLDFYNSDEFSDLYNFDAINSELDAQTKDVDKKATELSQKMENIANGTSGTWSGAAIKIGGVSIDESFWTNFQAQLEEWQTDIDENPAYQLTVKPVLDTTDFNEQFESFNKLFSGSMPVSLGAVIEIGNQPLPINDKSIVDEIRLLRIELQATTTALQSTLYSVDGNLANHIDGVAGAIGNIKIPNAQPASLKDVDNGLYRSAKNSAMTGVSTYPNIRTKPVPMEE